MKRLLWVLCLALVLPLSARAQAWHVRPLGLEAGMAVVEVTAGGTETLLLAWDGGTGVRVLALEFPLDGPPVLGAEEHRVTTAAGRPDLVTHGTGAILTAQDFFGSVEVRGAGGWSTVSTGANAPVVALALSGTGLSVAMVDAAAVGGFQNVAVSQDAGSGWALSSTQDPFHVHGAVALFGTAALAAPRDAPGELSGTTDVSTGPWTGLGETTVGLSVFPGEPGGPSFLVVGAGGYFATLTGATAAPSRDDLPSGADLVGAALSLGELRVATARGEVVLRPPGSAWSGASTEATGLTASASLLVLDAGRVLVAGADASGPAWAWRNRPPSVSGPGATTVPASSAVALSATASDPDGETPTVTWQCPAEAGAVFTPANGETTSVTLAPTGGGPDFACEVVVTDAAGAEARGAFTLTETTPLPRLAYALDSPARTVGPGELVPVRLALAGDAVDPLVVRLESTGLRPIDAASEADACTVTSTVDSAGWSLTVTGFTGAVCTAVFWARRELGPGRVEVSCTGASCAGEPFVLDEPTVVGCGQAGGDSGGLGWALLLLAGLGATGPAHVRRQRSGTARRSP